MQKFQWNSNWFVKLNLDDNLNWGPVKGVKKIETMKKKNTRNSTRIWLVIFPFIPIDPHLFDKDIADADAAAAVVVFFFFIFWMKNFDSNENHSILWVL